MKKKKQGKIHGPSRDRSFVSNGCMFVTFVGKYYYYYILHSTAEFQYKFAWPMKECPNTYSPCATQLTAESLEKHLKPKTSSIIPSKYHKIEKKTEVPQNQTAQSHLSKDKTMPVTPFRFWREIEIWEALYQK